MSQALDHTISKSWLLRFSLPSVISMVFTSIYTTVDGMFVSRMIETDALSAVNIVYPIINCVLAVGTMFGTGGSAIVAKKMGEGKQTEAMENFSLLVSACLLLSLVFSIIAIQNLQEIIVFLGADDTLFTYCKDYALYSIYFFPMLALSTTFQVFFIVAGRASLGLFLSVCGGITNIVLDYVFIGPLDMGIKGAAIATGLGYCIPAFTGIVFFLFLNRKGTVYFARPRFSASVLFRCATNGSSEMVTNLSMGVVTLLLNLILMDLAGSDGVASITIILYTQFLLSSAYLGYAIGIAPVISYNYGKRDTQRLRGIHFSSLQMIGISSVVTFVCSLCFAEFLVAIFAPAGSSVYNMAVHGYRLFAICFLFMGVNIYASAFFTALSNGVISAMLSFLRTLVFVVIAVTVLPLILALNGVWLAIPAAEGLGFGMSILCFYAYRKVYGITLSQ